MRPGPFQHCALLLAAIGGALSAAPAFVIHGVDLPSFHGGALPPSPYTSFSGTTLSGIRRRWNFNAVRIPLAASCGTGSGELHRIVKEALALDLVVLLQSSAQSELYWRDCAKQFGALPKVLFEAPPQAVPILRAAGVRRPIIVDGESSDPNIIRDIHPAEGELFGAVERTLASDTAQHTPAVATGWNLPVNTPGAACDSIPRDPTAAEAMVQANLNFFEANGISWIAPAFEPGALLGDYWSEDATTLEYGWSCSPPKAAPIPGIGEAVRFHLWNGGVRQLFIVNGGGGMRIPRGGIAIGYGPILADRDALVRRLPVPFHLAGVSVTVTDRLGATRRAKLEFASEGWGQVNFIVPEQTAPGPARITVVRDDGSRSTASANIVDFEPSLWSAYGMGFGPAIAFFGQDRPAFYCTRTECRALPIPISKTTDTTIRLHATGLRFAGRQADIRVRIGGIAAKPLSFRAAVDPGNDDLLLELPPTMRGLGESDVICSVNGRLANVVRVNLGSSTN